MNKIWLFQRKKFFFTSHPVLQIYGIRFYTAYDGYVVLVTKITICMGFCKKAMHIIRRTVHSYSLNIFALTVILKLISLCMNRYLKKIINGFHRN